MAACTRLLDLMLDEGISRPNKLQTARELLVPLPLAQRLPLFHHKARPMSLEGRRGAGCTPCSRALPQARPPLPRRDASRRHTPPHRVQEICETRHNSCGGTALHIAASRAWPEIVQLLLGLGCPVHLRDSSRGATAMHHAVAEVDKRPMEEVLAVLRMLAGAAAAARPSLNLISAQDEDGKRPLHWATEWASGQAAAMEFLLNGGCPVDAQDDEGATAMHIAVFEVCKARRRPTPAPPGTRKHPASFAVARACMPALPLQGDLEAIKLLLQHRARCDVPDKKHSQTALHYAAVYIPSQPKKVWEASRLDIVQLLLAAAGGGAERLANLPDLDGTTALHIAALHNQLAEAAVLLAHGADKRCAAPLCCSASSLLHIVQYPHAARRCAVCSPAGLQRSVLRPDNVSLPSCRLQAAGQHQEDPSADRTPRAAPRVCKASGR